MKRILFFLLLAANTAFGATLNPIQLLNPAGSISGQAIVSTGASTAPTWGNVAPLASPNFTGTATITSSATGGTAFNISATSNTSAGAAILFTGNGATTPSKYIGVLGGSFYVLNSAGAAQIFSLTDGGNATFAGSIKPSSTAGIVGTTTNDSPAAGSIGEAPTNTTSGTSMTINTAANCTSLSLTAGNWLVWGMVTFTPNAATTVAQIIAAISTTSATLPTFGTYQALGLSFTTGANQSLSAMPLTVKLASSGTVYLVGQSSFSVNTMTCTGFIYALRIR